MLHVTALELGQNASQCKQTHIVILAKLNQSSKQKKKRLEILKPNIYRVMLPQLKATMLKIL